MNKVVAFVGSPRKNGNVSSIVNEILRGAEEQGAETNIYYLNELNIRGCQSCFYCREHESCCIKDDMKNIYKDIKDADSVVIGSPIFICQVSAQTKLLLDRLYPLTDKNHKPRFGIKKLIMVYTQGAPFTYIFRRYIKYNGRVLKPMGLKVFKDIIAPKAITRDASKNDKKIMEKAYKLGKSLYMKK